MPEDRVVLVSQVCPFYTDGKPELKIVTERKFLKGYLTKTGESELPILDLSIPEEEEDCFTFAQEDSEMSAKTLIKLAASDAKQDTVLGLCETYLSKTTHRGIGIAIRRAERNNEFVAMANLTKLQERYTSPDDGRSAPTTMNEKDSKSLKVVKTDKVPELVWDAIMSKVRKIGNVTKSEKTGMTIMLKKSDADAFTKAAQKVAGITVSDA